MNGVFGLPISTDIKPTTAREFRAEFVNTPTAPGLLDGPRILELDGFADFVGPRPSIRHSEVEISWESATGLSYQVEYRDAFPDSNWTALGSAIVGDGNTMRITDKIAPGATKRFYRVRSTE